MGLFSRAASGPDGGRLSSDGSQRLKNARSTELLDSFEAARLGCFWTTDGCGQITYVSQTAVRSIGCEPHDLIGWPLAIPVFQPPQTGYEYRYR